jgi:hypothetical protein
MTKWLLLTIGAVVASAAVAVLIGQALESANAEQLAASLRASASSPARATVEFASFSDLPPPVARYFRHVLTDGQRVITSATLRQTGEVRTSTASDRWLPFTSTHLVSPPGKGFVWNAMVDLPFAAHLRVLDSYVAGVGAGRVSLLSAFVVASEAGVAELNSGALHRYLAEGVWFPTALLPQSGVEWTPIDERSALAKLTDGGTTVSLEFRFNEAGDVTGIYSTGRFGRFGGDYARVPWEGRFSDYRLEAGMLVPRYGEVGWYEGGALQWVWKGWLVEAQYEYAPSPTVLTH